MNNSSAQESYSITSLDTITISGSSYTSSASSSTITLTLPSTASNGISYVSGSSIGGFASTINGNSINWNAPQEEFVDCLPDVSRIKSMCKEYPGLKIAYEKFVTTYKLVKDDYDTPEDQRPKP